MKHNISMITGSALLAGVLIFGLYGAGKSVAGDDDSYRSSVKVDPLYRDECGSCHIAYPAQLLPTKSWRKIMAGLEDHFDENAEVDEATKQSIENYLVKASGSGTYRKLFRNLGNLTPLRITELPYFIHEHDEIPSRYIKANDKVKSLSQCDACHQKAERGGFDEDDIFIPGFGRWDD